MIAKTLLYVVALSALSTATGLAVDKSEEVLKVDEKNLLPRVVILVVLGGLSYALTHEFTRKFEPDMIKDLKNSLPF